MNTDIIIRPCRPEECATILQLWQAAGSIPSQTASMEYLSRLVRENGDLFLVAEKDGQIVGTVIGGWDGWRGNIYRLAVLPQYQRRGIGRALIDEVEQRLKAKGAGRISIIVAREETLAKAFWDALNDRGYEYDHRIIRYVKTI